MQIILLQQKLQGEIVIMANKKSEKMENFKMEAASEVGVDLKKGYNGDLTSRETGSVGGRMVKKMIEDMESKMK